MSVDESGPGSPLGPDEHVSSKGSVSLDVSQDFTQDNNLENLVQRRNTNLELQNSY